MIKCCPFPPPPHGTGVADRRQTGFWHILLISLISIVLLCGRTVAWQVPGNGYSCDLCGHHQLSAITCRGVGPGRGRFSVLGYHLWLKSIPPNKKVIFFFSLFPSLSLFSSFSQENKLFQQEAYFPPPPKGARAIKLYRLQAVLWLKCVTKCKYMLCVGSPCSLRMHTVDLGRAATLWTNSLSSQQKQLMGAPVNVFKEI